MINTVEHLLTGFQIINYDQLLSFTQERQLYGWR